MTDTSSQETQVAQLIEAFGRGDVAGLRAGLANSFVAYVTNSDGSVRQVVGAENYVAIVDAMDPQSANLRLDIPQITTIEPGLVMAMIEVHAERHGRTLHNFSGQLFKLEDGLITRIWMVEALPAASDEFWSATEPA